MPAAPAATAIAHKAKQKKNTSGSGKAVDERRWRIGYSTCTYTQAHTVSAFRILKFNLVPAMPNTRYVFATPKREN